MAVIFPDIEAWAADFLTDRLADSTVKVHARDAGTGVRRILVRRDGGPQGSVVTDVPRLNIRCFDRSADRALDLARTALAHMTDSPGNGPVRRFRQTSGPVWALDVTGPSYFFTCELTVRGTDL